MFDNPSQMLQKNIGILDFDKDLLDKINVMGKKPNTLPPLQAHHNMISTTTTPSQPIKRTAPKASTTNFPPQQRWHGVAGGNTVGLTQLSSSPPTVTTTNSMDNNNNNTEYLTKVKENAKNRQNDFDALCAQLVQQTENERKQRKYQRKADDSPRKTPRNSYGSDDLNNDNNNDTNDTNIYYNNITSSRAQPVSRKNTFRVHDKDEDSLSDDMDDTTTTTTTKSKKRTMVTKRENTITQKEERPKTSARSDRPKTGYGRRRAYAQEQ